jgi:hypothetical protein
MTVAVVGQDQDACSEPHSRMRLSGAGRVMIHTRRCGPNWQHIGHRDNQHDSQQRGGRGHDAHPAWAVPSPKSPSSGLIFRVRPVQAMKSRAVHDGGPFVDPVVPGRRLRLSEVVIPCPMKRFTGTWCRGSIAAGAAGGHRRPRPAPTGQDSIVNDAPAGHSAPIPMPRRARTKNRNAKFGENPAMKLQIENHRMKIISGIFRPTRSANQPEDPSETLVPWCRGGVRRIGLVSPEAGEGTRLV